MEILDQALHFRRLEPIDHAVFMGMGEPMLNVDAVLAAARRLPDVGVTHRRTTISTVGWLPGLTRFVDEVEEPIRLAFSLHAPTDALRSELMPVNDRYPLEDVLAECHRYFELRRRKVFVEYVMLDDVNDSVEHARELAELLDRDVFKVNLIPYNPTGMYDGSSRTGSAFKYALERRASAHRAPHPRPRHRGRVWTARGDWLDGREDAVAGRDATARSSGRCVRTNVRSARSAGNPDAARLGPAGATGLSCRGRTPACRPRRDSSRPGRRARSGPGEAN